MKIITPALVTAAVVTMSVLSPASADTHHVDRGCISKHEFFKEKPLNVHIMTPKTPQTRQDVRKATGARGKRIPLKSAPGGYWNSGGAVAINYKMCGLTRKQGSITVTWTKDRQLITLGQAWVSRDRYMRDWLKKG